MSDGWQGQPWGALLSNLGPYMMMSMFTMPFPDPEPGWPERKTIKSQCANPKCKEDPSKNATLVCKRCRTVQYHSKKCQLDHYKEHRVYCRTYALDPETMAFTPEAQTKQNFGSFFFKDENRKVTPPVSTVCANPNCKEDPTKAATQRCTRCKIAMYHNRECQVGHWKEHKSMCNGYIFAKRLDKANKEKKKAGNT